ncbi:hypothetical protein H8B09_05595 [Paenibacillus sp. PR3]|uniref:Flagellar hook-length control protein-like C-terminal domain-containing protein n=1 Tax=Paenibacillus terricola TaxID=2763503 RepID=A0ABR8MQE5_9BACL|nr:hypothetical protein [Paenibacillus terricola]MBD3918219.1 hypothetical protein [Paenibacillus terricola]
MNNNITQMMRGLLGDVKSGDTRKVELKPGQVVRGVVMKVESDSKDAIVQINGVQVRAKLETPLAPGQTAMLKVQPESTSESIVLKPVETAADQATDETIRQLVKAAGMPETKWAMDLVRDLKRDGIPLTRDVIEALKKAVESVPKGVDPEEWMRAAAVALRRGMPVTEQTVAGMRQIMYGKPVHQLLADLEMQLESIPSQQAVTSGAHEHENAVGDTLARLKVILADMKSTANGSTNTAAADAESNHAGDVSGAKNALTAQASRPSANLIALQKAAAYEAMELPGDTIEMPMNRTAVSGSAGQTDSILAKASAETTIATGQGQAAPSSIGSDTNGWIGKMLQLLGVNHEQELLHETAKQLASSTNDNKTAAAPVARSNQEPADQQVSMMKQPSALDLGAAPARPTGIPTATVTVGADEVEATVEGGTADHAAERSNNGQQQAQAQAASAQGRTTSTPHVHSPQLTDDGMPAPLQNGIRPTENAVSETLKSTLLSLAAMDDAPPQLRETAQQLIHHITGQQLMLAPERNGSVLTHVTLFIPIQDENGSQTASVHVQTRRGAKNELDAANCRLLFDLHLKVLGDTVVDVHVVDKIVNLNIWNDHPVMNLIADGERGAVANALNNAGYQLLTFNVRPTMRHATASGDQSDELISDLLMPDIPSYGGTPYKGVDIKI